MLIVLVNLCHFFSSSWCQELAATSACGSSWTFLFILKVICKVRNLRKIVFLIYGKECVILQKVGHLLAIYSTRRWTSERRKIDNNLQQYESACRKESICGE